MTRLRLQIQGDIGTIPLPAFLSTVENWLDVLRDLDAAISRRAGGSLDWVITDLGTGSLCLEAEACNRIEDVDCASQVALAAVTGLDQLEREGTTPPYVSERGLEKVRSFVGAIGRHGVVGIRVSYETREAQLSARASANVDRLIPTRYTSAGSVEGRLEMISVHRKPRFVVYHDPTNKAVSCGFSEEWLETVKNALGKRVNVAGVVHWNYKGEPTRIEGEDLRIIDSETTLPSIVELAGSMPGLTGELSTDEYIRRIRGAA